MVARKQVRRKTTAKRSRRNRLAAAVAPLEEGFDLQGALVAALDLQKQGDFAAAEAGYAQVLETVPNNPDALHLLGALRFQQGDGEAAIELIEQALSNGPPTDQYLTNLGAALQTLGRADEARDRYREALDLNPSNAAASANLGVLLREQGDADAAIVQLREARELNPDAVNVHLELAHLYLAHEQFEDAAESFERYLAFAPDDVGANNNLGFSYARLGRLEEAEAALRRAYDRGIRSADVCNNLGNILREQGKSDEAETFILAAIEQDPGRREYRMNLSSVLNDQGRHTRANEILEALRRDFPDDINATLNFATGLSVEGRYREALDVIGPLVERHPDNAEVWAIYANVQNEMGEYELAETAYRKTLDLDPDHLEANLNFCVLLRNKKMYDEANANALRAIELEDYDPKHYARPYQTFRIICNFEAIERFGDLIALLESIPVRLASGAFLSALVEAREPEDVARMVEIHRRWGESVDANARENPLPPLPPPAPGGKIKVGFLSSDLREHAVAKHAVPLFRNFDGERFEIHCYSPWDVKGDAVQQEIKSLVDSYTAFENATSREIAERIRADGIDILIELNGHTQGGRLDALAYRPAPVQIGWLGYPFTSGLSATDYYIVDEDTRPVRDEYLLETPLVLPDSWVSFDEYPAEPIAETLPVERNGHITFGTLNNPYKFTPWMIEAWARIMVEVPDSRFLFVRTQADSLVFCSSIIKEFGKHGIDHDRLIFYNNQTRDVQHLACYNEIDITLDTSPVTGGTTTCDAMWMGVPVITLVGDGPHQRLSYSLLKSANLEELCAHDLDKYVEIAVALANDRESLSFLRQNLRSVLRNSILYDGKRFAENFCDTLFEVAKRHGLV